MLRLPRLLAGQTALLSDEAPRGLATFLNVIVHSISSPAKTQFSSHRTNTRMSDDISQMLAQVEQQTAFAGPRPRYSLTFSIADALNSTTPSSCEMEVEVEIYQVLVMVSGSRIHITFNLAATPTSIESPHNDPFRANPIEGDLCQLQPAKTSFSLHLPYTKFRVRPGNTVFHTTYQTCQFKYTPCSVCSYDAHYREKDQEAIYSGVLLVCFMPIPVQGNRRGVTPYLKRHRVCKTVLSI